MFAIGLTDMGSIPGRVIPKTWKKKKGGAPCLTLSIIKAQIKDKMEQFRQRSSAPPLHLYAVANEKGAFRLPSYMVANFIRYHIFLTVFFKQIYEHIDGILTGAATAGQSGPGSNGILQISSLSETV